MGEIAPALRAALADRYRVERELGRGGMATVYLATDTRHQRRVAIKVLAPEVASLVSVDRFLQEIRVMATLQHPHILPLFDSGDVAGELYYVMPYVEGETLRARMARERRLGVDEATRITREVASALDFAHRQGIVHRDIKPENILLSDGHALVADFGIARALLADAATAQRLTATGVALGTPGYMSPEQAAGDHLVDARADVYALGAVTHEMLAGEPPFTGPSAQAVLARVLTESPPPLAQVRRGIAPGISAAVQKALATEPADRYATAVQFAHALADSAPAPAVAAMSGPARRLWPVAAGALALALAGGLWLSGRTGTAGQAERATVRVAVVPFRESGETASSGFAGGLTAALRSDLATLPNVDVIAGTSVDALGDSARTPRYVAQQLGATHVISGTVQWSRTAAGETRVRVAPELIALEGGTEQVKPGEPVEDRLDDLFQTQARVSNLIATSLGVRVSAEAATRLARPPTRIRAAYEAYLKSRYADDDISLLQQAVALDSTFALAWADLGQSASMAYQGTLNPAMATLARQAAMRALTLDSSSAPARMAMLLFERHVTRDFEAAVRHGRECMRLAPGDARYMHTAAAALWNAGQIEEALELARRGAALDPRNASAVARVATILIWQRDFLAAEVELGRALQVSGYGASFINLDSVLIPVARGNVQAARSFLASMPQARQSTASMAMREWHLGWTLDSALRAGGMLDLRRLRLPYAYHAAAAQEAWLTGQVKRQSIHADSAIAEARARLEILPGEERVRMAMAFAYAYAGRFREAVIQADSANATRSAWKDGFQGPPISLNFAEVLALSGEADHAIALVDSLLKVPGFVTPEYLRVDPYFASLRSDPRFRRLTGQ